MRSRPHTPPARKLMRDDEPGEPVAVLIPPSMHAGRVFRVVGREGRAVAESWDVPMRAWVLAQVTATAVAHMPPAGPELLTRLGITRE